jgi:NAD(P)-dependent dehydrogenase (short-subunit alcohol dehydrogenase family)
LTHRPALPTRERAHAVDGQGRHRHRRACGIGFAAFERFYRQGATVVLSDLKGHEEAAAKLTGGRSEAVAIRADVTSDESVNALVSETARRFGRFTKLMPRVGFPSVDQPIPSIRAGPGGLVEHCLRWGRGLSAVQNSFAITGCRFGGRDGESLAVKLIFEFERDQTRALALTNERNNQ